ncbi:THO complex subunit 6 homolog [Diorhabda carinulata]|uniref:THO complex subunit 6 homolog n=1 Tax=Diorhabda carinulata TaxID=1163345 RepID=UPI0025A01E1E|nr:THO complex subunit 6 homolog [Diorhabda carinulata]
MIKKNFYSTILSQTISPCEKYLVVGDIYGTLSIFHLSKITNCETILTKEDLKPRYRITVKEGFQVNSLLTTQHYLVVGIVGEIYGYNWKSIRNTHPQADWIISIPNQKDAFKNADINVIRGLQNKHIFIGCGDNNIYVYDLESRKLLKTLSCHTDYIHCLSDIGADFISGSEDGVVNIWDTRTYKVIHSIKPHLDDKVGRPAIGKWIGAVSCNDDYVLCGGGPRLSLWHYRFLTNSTVFPINDKGIHVAEIRNEKILAGGRSRLFYQMSFVGDIVAEIPVSPVTVYSAVYKEEPNKILSLAGSSSKIDICSNFMYRNQQLSLY